MAGARNVHDDIVVNILAELRNQLRGSACRPFTDDGSIETKPGRAIPEPDEACLPRSGRRRHQRERALRAWRG
jgi:hypothetical protein